VEVQNAFEARMPEWGKNSFTTALNSLDLAEANYRQAKQTKDAARRNLVGERPAPPLLDPDAVYSFTRRAE
jgi:hypothetical protein